jgi:hypothetical protein
MSMMLRSMIMAGLICFGSTARAQEEDSDLQFAVGVVCDSAQQVERYLSLSDGKRSLDDALRVVNKESKNPSACGFAAIAFISNEQVSSVNFSHGMARVMRIKIIAAATEKGWRELPEVVQYLAVFEKLDEA